MTPASLAPATFADLPAFGAAHATNQAAGTGCTVVVAPEGAVAGVDVRGGAPATRETDLLRPENMVQEVHAVAISGGSAYGLEAAGGVMKALAEAGCGFELAGLRVPIVPQACLFDLPVGEPVAPDMPMGAAATRAALERVGTPYELEQGNVGAGCGATVGKLLGPQNAMKGGFGWPGAKLGSLAVVACVAVNAAGNVRGADGQWLAGAQRDGRIVSIEEAFGLHASAATAASAGAPCANTTLGIVLTNAKLTKAQATKASSMAHDAYARAIWPVHTTNDGDTIFTMASGEVEAMVDTVGVLACAAMQAAIESAVLSAEGAYGLKAARDLPLQG